MTALRPMSLPAHAAFELLIGVLTLIAPFALGFGPAGTVLAVLGGVVLMGLALNAAVAGLAPLAVAAQHAYDAGMGVGLAGAAIVLGLAGDALAAGWLAVVAVVQLALTASTRYTAV